MKHESIADGWYAEDVGLHLPAGCDKPVSREALKRALVTAENRGDSDVANRIRKLLAK